MRKKGSNPQNKTFKRVQFDFTEETYCMLEELVTNTGSASKAEAIRRLIHKEHIIFEKLKTGKKCKYIFTEEGKPDEIMIFI